MVRIIGKKQLHPHPFSDEVHDMGDFIKDNPKIFGDDVKIISRELAHGPDDRRVDFLIYYPEDELIGIVELKKDTADEKVLLQTLRYADWLIKNPDTLKYTISKSKLGIDPESIDVTSLKIIIVAPKISKYAAELAQYIKDFEFEFIQLQRFKDEAGDCIAVIDPIEAEIRKSSASSQRIDYDQESYAARGIDQGKLDSLAKASDELSLICERDDFLLSPRYFKHAIKFQTSSGRNAFFISIRKQKDHYLKIVLGRDFDIKSAKVSADIKTALKKSAPTSRVWQIPLSQFPIESLTPLLANAYNSISNG